MNAIGFEIKGNTDYKGTLLLAGKEQKRLSKGWFMVVNDVNQISAVGNMVRMKALTKLHINGCKVLS